MFFKYLFKRGYFLLLKGFQATNVLIIYARQRKAKTHTHTQLTAIEEEWNN